MFDDRAPDRYDTSGICRHKVRQTCRRHHGDCGKSNSATVRQLADNTGSSATRQAEIAPVSGRFEKLETKGIREVDGNCHIIESLRVPSNFDRKTEERDSLAGESALPPHGRGLVRDNFRSRHWDANP